MVELSQETDTILENEEIITEDIKIVLANIDESLKRITSIISKKPDICYRVNSSFYKRKPLIFYLIFLFFGISIGMTLSGVYFTSTRESTYEIQNSKILTDLNQLKTQLYKHIETEKTNDK